MVRELPLVSALLILAGCPGTAETAISMELAATDLEARARLARLEIELWAPTDNACRDLVAWRSETCPRGDAPSACSPAPSPRDRAREPSAASALQRGPDGGWSPLRLPALDQGPWDLRVRGVDADGAPIVYGCLTLEPGAPRAVSLWRPWCDVQACAGSILPACLPLARVRCPAIGEAASPSCTITSTAMVLSWEEKGVACPPDGARIEPCRPASVSCTPQEQLVVTDGVCPREPTCSDTRQSCSPNVEPLECGVTCTPGAPCSVAGRTCRGRTECIDRASSVCAYPVETCNTVDDDCDDLGDEVDADALAWCNRERIDFPASDRCGGGRCMCGQGPPCEGRTRCVRGACERIEPPGDAGAEDAKAGEVAPLDARTAPDARAPPLDAGSAPDAPALDAREPIDARTAPDAADAGLTRDSGATRG